MARHREPVPRLNINPTLNMQQPGMNMGPGQAMFSPALQQGFHPSFPMNNNAMQTPMQPFFNPQPPHAPGRPTHHQGHASIAHLAAAGIRPPNGFPITPLGGHFPRASMMGIPGHPSGHPFPNRNRRQLSIGGPPKAVLGGPARKLSPLPLAAVTPVPPPQKVKKINVNLPKETVLGEEGQPATRPIWARTTLDGFEYKDQAIVPVELTTRESFPPDNWRNQIPDTLDVFLPGKRSWDDIKQKAIEEKLEKLGVEKGSGSNVPHIHAPHARAASISTPADPQILLYKLNKLQQSQDATGSSSNSLTSSPNPPFGILSSSPHRPSPRFLTNRHGHTMSLALPLQPFESASTFDPFGPAVDIIEPIPHSGPSAFQEGIHAPQGRVPVVVSSLAPPQLSRPTSRPDFIRGFGLDITEEEEEEEESVANKEEEPMIRAHTEFTQHEDVPHDTTEDIVDYGHTSAEQPNGSITASQSRLHSRHVSRLSAALSTRSAGNLDDEEIVSEEDMTPPVNVDGVEDNEPEEMDLDDVVGEWTGSEDIYLDPSDTEGSIGEWSNPSDEERARQQRLERRTRRRASQQVDQPRRLPNFPRPPENTIAVPLRMDDDIISNPSEEGAHMSHGEYLGVEYYSRPPSNLSGSSRPLPPLPHSRVASGQHTSYDPAHAHSRATSDQFVYSNNTGSPQNQPSFAPRRESLNPFAKPFVFGAARDSGSWGQGSSSGIMTPPKALMAGHSRIPSIGKPLNVAAPEFKPGAFNFRPPPGVPAMPVPATLDLPRPLPDVPSSDVSPFKVQGREKRQRRGSTASWEEEDSMTSFRFPPAADSPQSIRRAPDMAGSRSHKLNPSAEPFTFAGFSAVANLPYVPREEVAPTQLIPERAASPEETLNDESTAKADNGDPQVDEFTLPSAAKSKRAPIPLDFKHPVSTNTVPAGLFKALVNNLVINGEDRTRRTVRSRLSSREIFEHSHRPSMDDLDVAAIAQNASRSRSRLVTDPGHRQASSSDDVFGSAGSHLRRRSSFTDALRPIRPLSRSDDAADSSNSAMSLTGRLEMQQSERRIEAMLDEGFVTLLRDLKKETNGQLSATQTMISEIKSLFKTQLRESAARSLENSHMDARGEIDYQLLKDVIEDGNKELLKTIGEDLRELQQQVWQARAGNDSSANIAPIVEQMSNRTISAIIEAISELSARQEAISHVTPARERDATVDKLMTVLTPVLASFRSEPIDYEFLTNQLTQAVKPHISQLIDLASDKRETASLIVDRIIPLLPASTLDVDAITLQLTTEVRRAIAPIDAFEIKEQVADLVVERLDSRLAVRDKAFNLDNLAGKVTEGVMKSIESLQGLPASIDLLANAQTSTSLRQDQLSSGQDRIINLVSELPLKFSEELQNLKSAQASILSKLEQPSVAMAGPDENVLLVKDAVENMAAGQTTLIAQAEELRSLHEHILEKLDTLPDSLQTATSALQSSEAEFASFRDTSKREIDDLRKSSNDYQTQLTKARGLHGQVRVEKDVLNEKLLTTEGERERLRSQVKDLQSSSTEKAAQVIALEARNSELEDALAKALARLQASDVVTQTNQEKIKELEKVNQEATAESQSLKSKVDALQMQATFASRDKESVTQALSALQQQYDHLASQQSHWDDLHRASEKIEMLTHLVGQADNEELKDLRRYRERTKLLESEHAALQKRFKEQESKVGNSERAALAARQSLAQAQQRSSEWERRAKEYEGQLEMTQTKLDHAEQTQAQLDADYSLVKLQLEEREADDRLVKDQQHKLHEQVASLEAKLARLQSDLDKAKLTKVASSQLRNISNGTSHVLPRPDSRASTIYDNRSTTPQNRRYSQTASVRSDTPPQPSVRDSMHAPRADIYKPTPTSIHAPHGRYPHLGPGTPKVRHLQQHYRRDIPSPTPSTVSNAPTQGDDGWWS